MAVQAKNNSWGLLSTAMSQQTTTLVLQSGHAARFPLLAAGDWFYATIFDGRGNVEIVKVTATQADNFTVVRGQDGTSPQSWQAAVRVQINVGIGFWNDFLADVNATAVKGRNFATPVVLSSAPQTAKQAATIKYLADNFVTKVTPIQAAIGFSPVKQTTGNKVYFGWNGSDIYCQVDSTFMGNVWRDSTYNPATKANAGAQCLWNGGILQTGAINYSGGVVDVGNPWVMEGYSLDSPTDGNGAIYHDIYPRLVYLRNQ